MQDKSGFTLVDLMAVLVLALVATEIAATSLPATRQASLAAACRENLRGIHNGISFYGTENADTAPILPDMYVASKAPNYRDELKMGAKCLASDLGQGAQQNLCLAVKSNATQWPQFLCPATGHGVATRNDTRKYGLGEPGKTYIDYAIQIPYAITIDGPNPCPLTENMGDKVVLVADRGPQKDFANQWSPNHPGLPGENVLLGDGHVWWFGPEQGKPNAAGYGGNNIYTADKWEADKNDPNGAVLLSNGTENKTPTDPNGRFDSVLYAH